MTTFFNKDRATPSRSPRVRTSSGRSRTRSGHTFRDHSSFTETLRPEGHDHGLRLSYHYIVKGKGQVFAEVGHKITSTATGEVTFQAGQDDLVHPGLVRICEASASAPTTTSVPRGRAQGPPLFV